MRKVILLFMLAVCSHVAIAGEDQYQSEAQGAIREELTAAQLKSSCSLMASMAESDISKRPFAIASYCITLPLGLVLTLPMRIGM